MATWSWRFVLVTAALVVLSAAPARADLAFAQPEADAGEVRSGLPLTHRFAFVNDGSEVVEITGLRASCGCAKSKLEKRTYAPGEKGELSLDVRTLGQAAGARAWRLDVLYKDGGKERGAALTLRANVVVEVAVQPAAITLTTDSTVSHTITLTDLRPAPLTVAGARASSEHLKASVARTGQDAAGHRVVTVGLTVAASCPDGRHEETVILLTDDETYRELTVPVTVVKRPRQRVTASPAAVSLLAPRGQAAPSRIVLLRPAGEDAVAVEGVETDDPAVSCTWAPGPNNCVTLKVTFDRARVGDDRLRSAIHVRLSKPGRETITVPVTCRVE